MKNKGFSLVEVIVYMGLFSIFFGGAISSAYAILESSSVNKIQAILNDESVFILNKIDRVLSGKISVESPLPNSSSNKLKVNNNGNVTTFLLSGQNIQMGLNTETPLILNNKTIEVKNLEFNFNTEIKGSIELKFTLETKTSSGQTATKKIHYKKYLL